MSEQNCKDCLNHRDIGGEYPLRCQLTNVLLRQDGSSGKTCNYYNVDVSHMPVCINCKHFLGGGDWGLSCAKDYYTIAEPLDKICDKFERKEND